MTLLTKKLEELFGYKSFRPGQQDIIESVLAGNDTIALLPTGLGKSLCYQLPAYIINKPVLIISPLLSLMQDQVDQLKMNGEKKVIALNSFLQLREKKDALEQLHTYRFIFTSPEMLAQPHVQERIQRIELGLIVADEAHCISQWGFDFRPDYLKIGDLFQQQRPPILALTATATDAVMLDIEKFLNMRLVNRFLHSVNRPNIKLFKEHFQTKQDKLAWLLQHVQTTAGPGIIYASSRKRCDELAQLLKDAGQLVAAYHGGMQHEDRRFVQQQFIQGALDWIIATNAFGMGVHKADIRQILHETMPANMSNYMQEIGRAGRDGQESAAILLYAPEDERVAQFVAIDDLPTEGHVDLYANYAGQGFSVEMMKRDLFISDTAFRVLHYWMQQMPIDAVKQQLQLISQNKLQDVQQVLQLVQTTTCMRKMVVHYFGQAFEQQDVCCSNCGLTLAQIVKPFVEREQQQLDNWRERVHHLLPNLV